MGARVGGGDSVSIRTTRHVFCDMDAPGPCQGWQENPDVAPDDWAAAEMRAHAKRRGWKRVKVNGVWVDVCPPHAGRMTP